jgi:hypothetical protein
MKARSGREDEALRVLPFDTKRDLWEVMKGKRCLGLIRWNGAVPFRVRVEKRETARSKRK